MASYLLLGSPFIKCKIVLTKLWYPSLRLTKFSAYSYVMQDQLLKKWQHLSMKAHVSLQQYFVHDLFPFLSLLSPWSGTMCRCVKGKFCYTISERDGLATLPMTNCFLFLTPKTIARKISNQFGDIAAMSGKDKGLPFLNFILNDSIRNDGRIGRQRLFCNVISLNSFLRYGRRAQRRYE